MELVRRLAQEIFARASGEEGVAYIEEGSEGSRRWNINDTVLRRVMHDVVASAPWWKLACRQAEHIRAKLDELVRLAGEVGEVATVEFNNEALSILDLVQRFCSLTPEAESAAQLVQGEQQQ